MGAGLVASSGAKKNVKNLRPYVTKKQLGEAFVDLMKHLPDDAKIVHCNTYVNDYWVQSEIQIVDKDGWTKSLNLNWDFSPKVTPEEKEEQIKPTPF